MVFEKSLTAMVKGIRAHRGKETEYISQCLQEIQKEVTSKNMATKSMAILKLAYLTMFGYDMGWSTFAIVEVMSHNRFSTKRPGYLASAMSFNDSTDVGLLTINLFKKDFGGRSQYETGVAISCLSSICTPEICRDILGDLIAMCSSSRAYLRKKTALCFYRVFLKDPPALKTFFPKLKERLGDEDQGVLTASVNTFLELARKNAKNYLSLVPQLYHILVNTTNNWCSIKLMKLFQLLCPWEPRLPAKLVEPLTNLLHTTKAQSVEMEAIRCVLRVMPEGSAVAALALEKNQALLNSADRNLRFLALEMFKEVLDKPQFKDRIDMAELNAKVLTCIEESDTTARKLALQLLDRILSPATFAETVNHLLEFSKKTCSADEFFGTILRMGARDHYALVEEFEWYLVVLAEIARSPDSVHAAKAAAQFSDLAARVVQVRPCAVTLALGLLDRSSGATDGSGAGAGAVGAGGVGGTGSASKEAVLDIAMPMVGACAWVIGEYHGDFESPAEASFLRAARALLSKTIQTLEPSVQTQCVWAAAKLYLGSPSLGSPALVSELHELLASRLPAFVRSTHVDVSERATIAMHLSAFFTGDARRVSSGRPLFEDPLLPVSPEAQGSLPVPEELGIDEPFFQQEGPPAEAFAPVRPDPADAYALAAAYKDDFGFLAAKEQAGQAASPQRTDARSSMFYLQPRGQQGGGDERAGAAPGDGNAEARPADPLEQMRERLQARAGGAKYQVLRDEVRAPGAPGPPPAGPNPTGSASSAPGTQLPPPPEKALAELQGRLWFLCCRDDHVGVYACVKAKNARKQLLRIELRCECVSGNSSGASVSGIKVRFPSAVAAQEADPEGSLSLVAGVLRERSAKVKVNLALTAFLAPLTCPLDCELHYTLACQGDAAAVAHRFDLCLPSTTFLLPAVMSEDDSLEFIKNHQPVMTERTVVLSAAGRSAESMHGDLPAIVGKCAGLCHFHCIQQEGAASQISSQKFLLTAQPPAGGHSALPGQVALPEGTRIMCLCRGLARDGALDLSVKVKACQKGICDDVASHLVRVFAELVEGRLRET
mmetsp:Transcript_96578/g.288294  ORF Transcript_96578/g.288294 Transcript_96578/m.288294 type:complete len:1059 (+) Transcript_96578:137-3313(+)